MSRTPGARRPTRGPTSRRGWALTGIALLAGAALAGCTSDGAVRGPLGDPTAVPQAEQRLAERCGEPWAEPRGDNSFAVRPFLLDDAEGLVLTLELELLSGPDHGEHSPAGIEVELVDGGDSVVAVTTSAGELGGGGTVDGVDVWAAGRIGLTACPGVDEATDDATLPDGPYRLRAFGRVSPLDHLHGQQEYWLADPIEVTVTGGTVVGR